MNLWNLARSLTMASLVLITHQASARVKIHHRRGHTVHIRTKSAVHLRSRPQGPIIATLKPGQLLSIDSASAHSGWLHVHGNGMSGYVFRSLAEGTKNHTPTQSTRNLDRKHNSETSDEEAEGAFCTTCANLQPQNDLEKLGKFAGNVLEGAKDAVNTAGDTLATWIRSALDSAFKPRQRAQYLGGGVGRGNHSKGMCAQAAKEALRDAGICPGKLSGGSAIELHRNGIIQAECPRLRLSTLTDPRLAPSGSLIVYSGYAGRRRHNYGHIEAKLVANGKAQYCSDFCNGHPTKTAHNRVEAIYVLN